MYPLELIRNTGGLILKDLEPERVSAVRIAVQLFLYLFPGMCAECVVLVQDSILGGRQCMEQVCSVVIF